MSYGTNTKTDTQTNGTNQDPSMSTHNFSLLIFDKDAKDICWSKKKKISMNGAEKNQMFTYNK